jgi:hypothetical protein
MRDEEKRRLAEYVTFRVIPYSSMVSTSPPELITQRSLVQIQPPQPTETPEIMTVSGVFSF